MKEADGDGRRRGDGKPETFDFLGVTYIGVGTFTVLRSTAWQKLQAKLSEAQGEPTRRLRDPQARIWHPYPLRRLAVVTGGKSRMRESRSSGFVLRVVQKHESRSDLHFITRSRVLPRFLSAIEAAAGNTF